MMNDATLEIELRRLVDGRMAESERVAFLACIADEPQRWREVALAFVEEQVIRSEMASIHTPNRPVKPVVKFENRQGSRLGLLAVAITVVFALFLVGVAGRYLAPPMASSGTETVGDHGNLRTQDVDGMSKSLDDSGDVLIRPPVDQRSSGGDPNRDRNSDLWQSPVFGDLARETIREYGFDVHEVPVLFLFDDDDDRQYVIPQRHITLVSNKLDN